MPGLRAAFPVLDALAYLNAGTDGPVPGAAAAAAGAALDAQTARGRWRDHIQARKEGQAALRAAYAGLLGCSAADVALTTSTTEGVGKVLAGLGLGAGDEVLTSDEEHPGLHGSLMAAEGRGVRIRTAPLADLAAAVDAGTTLVACSHVGWLTGRLADPALRSVDVPVIYDGAQGVGAIPVDVRDLRCAAYAGSGQKWLCGADGTGFLYLEPAFAERVAPIAPGYVAFADPANRLLHSDARRHDTVALSEEAVAFSAAALEVLGGDGWAGVHARGPALSARLARELEALGRTVAPRDATTLVSWEDDAPEATAGRLGDAGIVVRWLPGTNYVRASVGAWNDDSDLDRLLAAVGPPA